MEHQLTVRIPASLSERLTRRALSTKRKPSELVRLALEAFLGETRATPVTRPIDLVRDLIGSVDSGIPDLGQRHREYLIWRLRHARPTDT
jgi:hypothetical protein